MDRPIRVAVVSPHEIIRAGAAQLLRSDPERVSVRDVSAHDGHLGSMDVVLYDLSALEDGGGEDLDHLVRGSCVVIGLEHAHSHRPGPEEAALRGRVARSISLQASAAEIIDAVVEAVGGPLTPGPLAPSTYPCGLVEREVAVLHGIARGLTNPQIAAESFLSVNTVKTYIRAAYRKIGVVRRSQAVAWVLEREDELRIS